MKVFEIFKDEGLPEKKMSNRERHAFLSAKFTKLEHEREAIKQQLLNQLVPRFQKKEVFFLDNRPNNELPIVAIKYHVDWDEQELFGGNRGQLYTFDIDQNESLIKWVHNKGERLSKIGRFWWGRGNNTEIATVHRRMKALDRALTRKPKRKRVSGY